MRTSPGHCTANVQPVLPAAIEQDILIALRPTDDLRVRVANVDGKFKPAQFELKHTPQGWDAGLVSVAEGGGWENYAKVAILECLARFFPDGTREGKPPAGLDLMMAGNVPPGAGLSVRTQMLKSKRKLTRRARPRSSSPVSSCSLPRTGLQG